MTRLELRGRRDGYRRLIELAVGPMDPQLLETQTLLRAGLEPLGVDLSEVGLAEGLQIWAKWEG